MMKAPQEVKIKPLHRGTIFSGDLQELDEKVKSFMAKSTNNETEGWKKGYICKVCGKEGQSIHIKNHIESHHLEGLAIPCNYCEKTARSRKELTAHKHYNTKYKYNIQKKA